MTEIRAFIAIELPEQIKESLSKSIDKLKPGQGSAVKWVNPHSIHLTLKFLGNIPAEKVTNIIRAIEGVAERAQPFTLELDGLGAFPNLRAPRVAWIGIGGDVPGITKLQRRIDQALIPLGFTPETREFSPHLTLGRVRDRATSRDRGNLGKALSLTELGNQPSFPVDNVSLMKSTLTSAGAIYDCLACVALNFTHESNSQVGGER